jgi:hypothetical protein
MMLLRVVSGEEWDSIEATGKILPSDQDWLPYKGGTRSLSITPTSFRRSFYVEYAEQRFLDGAREMHLIGVWVRDRRLQRLFAPDRECLYPHAYVHHGPLQSRERLKVLHLAVYTAPGKSRVHERNMSIVKD